jgi:hypothetical protein
MKTHGVITVLLATVLLAGCGDDPTQPAGGIDLADIAGDWEAVTMTAGDLVHALPHNNVIWCFAPDGSHCSLWRTAYGTYQEGSGGVVSARRAVLVEEALTGGTVAWKLSLSAAADTLRADLVEPGSADVDGWVLVRAVDAPEASCFE